MDISSLSKLLSFNWRTTKGRATQKEKAQKIKNDCNILVVIHTFDLQNNPKFNIKCWMLG